MDFIVKNVVNLLPYDVRVLRRDKEWHIFPADERVRTEFSSGKSPLYEQTNQAVAGFEPEDEESAITIAAATFREGPCLPPAGQDTLYLVEASIALAFVGQRWDLGWPEGMVRLGSSTGYRRLVVPRPFSVTLNASTTARPEAIPDSTPSSAVN
jgi:hypothetical protein